MVGRALKRLYDLLTDVLNIYYASARKNYFSGAHDHYDLWVFDELNVAEDTKETIFTRQDTMAAENNTLLRVLDGKKCRLDSKYGKLFLKKQNIPVVTNHEFASAKHSCKWTVSGTLHASHV